MPSTGFVEFEVWTNRFLGTEARATALLTLLEGMDSGRWIPERWGIFEPIRNRYVRGDHAAIISGWVEDRPRGSGEVSNTLLFTKRKPRALIMAEAWRNTVPDLNSISLKLDAKPFATPDGTKRLRRIMLGLVEWCDAIHGTCFHSAQMHDRVAQGTPLRRLERMEWLTFFGMPYVEMFGLKRLLQVPVGRVEELPGRGILLMAAPCCDSPEMTESKETLLTLEDYLGAEAFAGHGYPDLPCRVPEFDLSDTLLR